MRVNQIDISEIIAASQSLGDRPTTPVPAKDVELGSPAEVEVEFSEAAEKMQQTEELVEAAWSRLQGEPGVRKEAVEEVRRRLSEGYYDDGEILRRAAARILASLPGC